MTTEQKRKMLEAAAKACGVAYKEFNSYPIGLTIWESDDALHLWNPFYSSSDCAEMCAELEIDWLNNWESVVAKQSQEVWVRASIKDHDNSRLRAWMFAATTCAAKTQGYEP